MIFWILVVLTVLIVGGTFIGNLDRWDGPVLPTFVAVFLCGGIGFLIILGCGSWIPWNSDKVSSHTYQLKSIGTDSAISGRIYFLGGGYINEKRVLNYISDHGNGAIKVEQSRADASTIFEDSKTPTVTVDHYDHNNGWVLTWPEGSHDEYTFHIPAGSVQSDFTVANK